MRFKGKYLLSFIVISFCIFVGCGGDVATVETDEDNEETRSDTTETYNYTSDYAYNVNVIYFTPTDVEPLDNYPSR